MKRYINLILYKTYADLRVEASRGYLGIFWWVLEPVLYMAVFYVVFGIIFQRGGEDYVAFLLAGLVAWRWFDNTVRVGALSILANIEMMRQVYVPKYVFPSVTVVTNTVKFSIVLLLLLTFLVIYGILPTMTWMVLPVLILAQLVFILSVTWFLSIVVPMLPDLKVIIDSGLTLLFFMSGIFFDISEMPDNIAQYLRVNPMAILIESYRKILIQGEWPDWSVLGLLALFSLMLMMVGLYMHMRFDRKLAKIGLA